MSRNQRKHQEGAGPKGDDPRQTSPPQIDDPAMRDVTDAMQIMRVSGRQMGLGDDYAEDPRRTLVIGGPEAQAYPTTGYAQTASTDTPPKLWDTVPDADRDPTLADPGREPCKICCLEQCRPTRQPTITPRPQPIEADPKYRQNDVLFKSDTKEWRSDYEDGWRKPTCKCGNGYYCKAHGKWVPGDLVRKKRRPDRKGQAPDTCHPCIGCNNGDGLHSCGWQFAPIVQPPQHNLHLNAGSHSGTGIETGVYTAPLQRQAHEPQVAALRDSSGYPAAMVNPLAVEPGTDAQQRAREGYTRRDDTGHPIPQNPQPQHPSNADGASYYGYATSPQQQAFQTPQQQQEYYQTLQQPAYQTLQQQQEYYQTLQQPAYQTLQQQQVYYQTLQQPVYQTPQQQQVYYQTLQQPAYQIPQQIEQPSLQREQAAVDHGDQQRHEGSTVRGKASKDEHKAGHAKENKSGHAKEHKSGHAKEHSKSTEHQEQKKGHGKRK